MSERVKTAIALIGIALFMVTYWSGRWDSTLAHVGMNHTDCVRMPFSSGYVCGDQAQEWKQKVKWFQGRMDEHNQEWRSLRESQ